MTATLLHRLRGVRRVFLERTPKGIALRVMAWYVLLCVLLYSVQDELLFHPRRMTTAQWKAEADKKGLTVLPALDALVAEPAGRVPLSTVVLFHGNGEDALVRAWIADQFTARGHRVVLAEYPGFGPRAGALGKDTMLPDAIALVNDVRQRFPGPVQLWGESMGSAIASLVAAHEQAHARPVANVALVVPFDRLGDVANRATWHIFPVRWLLRHDFDNGAALSSYKGRVILALAKRDEVVGYNQGLQLHRRLAGSTMLSFDSGHNRWALALTSRDWDELLRIDVEHSQAASN